MIESSSWRQVSLVSYGTSTLRGDASLDDWYRHGVFWSARCEFRLAATRALIADDFPLWLDWLKRAGAQRLSLHPLSTLDLPVVAEAHWERNAIIVHHADRYQVWAHARERAAADERYDRILNEFDRWEDPPPNAAYYSAEFDSYWMALERSGSFAVKCTQWKQLWTAIKNDLELRGADAQLPNDAAFSAPAGSRAIQLERAHLPLLPKSHAANWPNRILRVLVHLSHRFDNDSQPKNESNLYVGASEEEAARIRNWGDRLHAWIEEVQVRAANGAGSGAGDECDATRYVAVPLLEVAEPHVQTETVETSASAPSSAGSGRESSKATLGAGCIVVLSGLVLLLKAAVSIIARHPMLSALFVALLIAASLILK
jgi:hypothetical protein